MSEPQSFDLVFGDVSTPPGQPTVQRAELKDSWLVIVNGKPVVVPKKSWPAPKQAKDVGDSWEKIFVEVK